MGARPKPSKTLSRPPGARKIAASDATAQGKAGVRGIAEHSTFIFGKTERGLSLPPSSKSRCVSGSSMCPY
jgi:hypothetical protein